jgi:hypothetical protein
MKGPDHLTDAAVAFLAAAVFAAAAAVSLPAAVALAIGIIAGRRLFL